ncbi:hypothetical protein BGZ72_008475 [Mortierella alpina]|nr:hypothetical protein BGZ72_008475 [Mortierella alpina]
MSIQVNTQDLHVAIVPSVAVEFTTIIDRGDMESPVSPSSDIQNTFGVEDAEEPSPMDNEEFAYPTNLTSEGVDFEDEEREQAGQGSTIKQTTSAAGYSGSKRFSLDDIDDMARGHFRSNNPSTGSDLIQVTVEDLLISEEQDRTIKASMDLCRLEQEHHHPTAAPSLSASDSTATKSSVTTTTITATIRSNGHNKKAISFDNTDGTSDSTEQEPRKKLSTLNQSQQKSKESRTSQPPEPRILSPAEQREADADFNIQKAIELHENNQLEDATHHFWLAAQSENPLGQLMYGLSLRHGWGCKPNPTEAILFLQRAAEYAMGELNELGPVQPRNSSSVVTTAAPSTNNNKAQQSDQQQQQHLHQKSSSNPTQQTLRRMGSMDRTAAMATARKELVMALYELGMSYLKGWGVTKDKSVAFTYFKIAADLGDPDSQNETALCYYEGIGTDKDMYQSAKYYRMAAAQGASQLGNSWIWKPKYDMYCAAENAAALAVQAGSPTGKNRPDPRSKFASAINTAMFQGTRGSSTAAGATASSSPTSTSPPSSKKKPKNQSSTPTSPSFPSPNYSVSTIASGLASVTAATTAGNAAMASSIKRPPATLSSVPTSASATSSVEDLRSPTSSMSSRSFKVSTEFSPTSPSPLAVSTPPTSSITEGKQGAGLTGTVEKKKARWSFWGGGTHRSTITPSPATTLHS